MALSFAKPSRQHVTVYAVSRKRGLRPGESMSDIAGHLARAIERDLGEPVFLQGTSTGGSVALQLAVDRPDLVPSSSPRRTGWAHAGDTCRQRWLV